MCDYIVFRVWSLTSITWFLWILEIMKYVLIGAWNLLGVCIACSGNSVPRWTVDCDFTGRLSDHCSNSVVWEEGKRLGVASGNCRRMVMCLFPQLHFRLQGLRCETCLNYICGFCCFPAFPPLPRTLVKYGFKGESRTGRERAAQGERWLLC